MSAALHVPPYSAEAEHSVLGSLLLDANACDQIGALRAEHFYNEANRLIFDEILAMLAAGRPADVVTVAESLDARGLSERTGGLAYLGELAQNTPTSANAGRYAQIIRDRATERQLLAAADLITAKVRGAGTTAEKLSAAQASVMEISE